MLNTTNIANALLIYLKKHHTGRQNAASSQTLEAVFHLKGAAIRKLVNALRCEGFPICSDTVGYYIAATQQEINNTITQLNSRITKIANAKNGLLNSYLKGKPDIMVEICLSIE